MPKRIGKEVEAARYPYSTSYLAYASQNDSTKKCASQFELEWLHVRVCFGIPNGGGLCKTTCSSPRDTRVKVAKRELSKPMQLVVTPEELVERQPVKLMVLLLMPPV